MTVKHAPIPAKPDDEKVKDDYVTELGGVEVRLPSLAYLRPGLIRQIRHMSQTDAMFTLLELSLSQAGLAEVDKLDPEEFEKFMDGWRIHSGVDLGES